MFGIGVDWRRPPLIAGILTTFALIPVWHRLPGTPPYLPSILYVSRFTILQPMLLTVIWWFAAGLPGLRALWCDRLRRTWMLALLALAGWVGLSNLWAFQREAHPEVAGSAAFQFGVVTLFVLAVAGARPRARWIVLALALGVLWNGALAVLQTDRQRSLGLHQIDEFYLDPQKPGVSVVLNGDTRWLRPYGLLPHPNILAGFFAIGTLATGTLALHEGRWLRRLATALTLFGLWGLLLTFSRAAWLGFAAGAFVMPPLLARGGHLPRRRLAFVALLALATALLFAATHRALLSSRAGLDGFAGVEQRSFADRDLFRQYAYRAIAERPLLGVGIANFPWRAAYYLLETDFDLRGDNVHQVYLQAWAELGVVGFALTALALVLGIEVALRRRPDAERSGLLAGVIALAVIGLFDHYPWTLIQFQTAWWGLLAAAGAGERAAFPAQARTAESHTVGEALLPNVTAGD